jgi:uncharacterized protein YeaO (DUF488 family)
MAIQIKRAYEEISESDGVRVLVDRIWPRGITKEELGVNYWFKEIAPSTELRKWFNHDPQKYQMFKEKYLNELRSDTIKKTLLLELKNLAKKYNQVTLVYAAKDKLHNQAEVLKECLNNSSASNHI